MFSSAEIVDSVGGKNHSRKKNQRPAERGQRRHLNAVAIVPCMSEAAQLVFRLNSAQILGLLVLTCTIGGLGRTAQAHVALDAPLGGETLNAGEITTIQWNVAVGHNTENWDLWFSETGDSGPWIDIAMDLPPGDISTGAIHTYDWTVPNLSSNEVRVRVRQDNSGEDYFDISQSDITIIGAPVIGDLDGSGVVNSVDAPLIIQALTDRGGYNARFPGIDADAVGDVDNNGNFDLGDIDDFSALFGPPASATAVPEPATVSLLFACLLPCCPGRRRRK